MRVLIALLALLVLVPTVEIAVILTVGHSIGAAWTIVLLLASALLGSWLLRRQSRRAWRSLTEAQAAGRVPATETAEGVLVLVGGLLMVFPGFLTDILGLVMLLPPVRRFGGQMIVRRIARRLPPQVATTVFGPLQVRSRRVRPRGRRAARAGASTGSAPASSAGVSGGPAPSAGAGPVIEGTVVEGDVER
jgi:UPF0716 protein FxsA